MFMFMLNCLLKKGGLKKVNEILDKTCPYFRSYSNTKRKEKFLKNYLSYSFDKELTEPFDIFYYLEHQDFENIFLNSNFCNSIPREYVLDALIMVLQINSELGLSENFISYFLHRVHNKEAILANIKKFPKAAYPALVKKLESFNDIDLIIKLPDSFMEASHINPANPDGYELEIRELLQLHFKDNFTQEEIERYVLESSYNFSDLHFLMDETKSTRENLDYIYSLVMKKSEVHENSDSRYGLYDNFVEALLFGEETIDMEYLENKIIASPDTLLKIAWIVNTNITDNSYKIIDDILKGDNEVIAYFISTLDCLNYDSSLEYTIKSLCKDYERLESILFSLCSKISVSSLDNILNIIYSVNPEYKLHQKTAFQLLLFGTDYYHKLLSEYSYSAEERMDIFNSFETIGKTELLSIYGAYLMTGDKTHILNPEVTQFTEERLARKINK